MDSRHLTTDQAKQVMTAVRPMLHYLGRLKERMEKRGFPAEDRLWKAVVESHDRVHRLFVELHYLSCEGGVGRPPKS